MRVTIAHGKNKAEIIDAVNRSFDQLFSGIATGPIQLSDEKRQWMGDTLNFNFTAQMGPLKTPIQGWVLVDDRNVTVDVDLGLLGKLIPQEKAKIQLENRVKGLLEH